MARIKMIVTKWENEIETNWKPNSVIELYKNGRYYYLDVTRTGVSKTIVESRPEWGDLISRDMIPKYSIRAVLDDGKKKTLDAVVNNINTRHKEIFETLDKVIKQEVKELVLSSLLDVITNKRKNNENE